MATCAVLILARSTADRFDLDHPPAAASSQASSRQDSGSRIFSSATRTLVPAVAGFIGIWLAAASAAAIDHLIDQRIDRLMARTSHRPLATGALKPWQVLVFAIVLGTLSMLLLVVFVNTLTAWLTFASLNGYAVVTGEVHPYALL